MPRRFRPVEVSKFSSVRSLLGIPSFYITIGASLIKAGNPLEQHFRLLISSLLIMHTLFQVTIASQPEAQQLHRTEFVIIGFDYCMMHSGNGTTGTLCFSSQPEPGEET